MVDRADRIAGALLGTAVGDALGLPWEGLSQRRQLRIRGEGPLKHRFIFGRGMISDDTEHACMTAQALLRAGDDPAAFGRDLAWRMRGWLLGMPAGIGWGTLRAILKLWVGFSPEQSGVFSAGNGPAMRTPILGICLGADSQRLVAFVRTSTRLTHTDPKAEQGALAIALAVAHTGSGDPHELLSHLERNIQDPELSGALREIGEALHAGIPASELMTRMRLKNGISGYMHHTVPFALYCWLRNRGDFRAAVEEAVFLGGDTDTVGAITGALAGAELGAGAIPKEWLEGILDWPRSTGWMSALAQRLAIAFPENGTGASPGPLPLAWPDLPIRNALFAGFVLGHGARRLLPPY